MSTTVTLRAARRMLSFTSEGLHDLLQVIRLFFGEGEPVYWRTDEEGFHLAFERTEGFQWSERWEASSAAEMARSWLEGLTREEKWQINQCRPLESWGDARMTGFHASSHPERHDELLIKP